MASAELERTTIDIDRAAAPRARRRFARPARVIRFDGFLTLYQEGRDDEDDEEGGRLPAMASGERVEREKIEATQHFTEPPPRYTEASLIKKMEELGIGRPSTYASTMETLRKREYVRLERKRLVPGGQGPHRHRLPRGFLQALRRVRFHRRPRGEARPHLRRRARRGRTCSAISGATSLRTSRRRARSAARRSSTR